MSYKSAKNGWMKILNTGKFIMQTNESKSVMKSIRVNEGNLEVNYKSSLEFRAFRYCDMNKYIKSWSVEPFSVKYLKPTTMKYHRYFIDLFIEFENGQKFLVEIKSSNETVRPTLPKKKTAKAMLNYKRAEETYLINISKWEAAKAFCSERGLKFIILTEKELK